MKRCTKSLAVKEKQIKTAIRSYYMPIKMAKIKSTDNIKC